MTDTPETEQVEKEIDLYAGMEADLPGSYTPEPEAPADDEPQAEPSGDDEGQSEDEAQASDEENAGEAQPKRKQTAAERIAELTKARREAEREASAKQAEVDRLRAMMESPKEQPVGNSEPNPADFDQGEFDPKYIDALVAFKTGEAVSKEVRQFREQQEASQRQSEAAQRHTKFVDACKADEVLGVAAFQLTQDPSAPVTPEMAEVILSSDDGVYIAAHLNENREEISRISALPPHLQGAAIAQIGREAKPASEAEKPTAPPQITKAPEPTHSGTGRKAAATKRPSDMSQSDYETWANKRQAASKSGW